VAVEDWPAILERARETIRELSERDSGNEIQAADLAEARSFLEWMEAGNFTFLGFRDYTLINGEGDGEYKLQGRQDSGLGILRETRRTPGEPDTTTLQLGAHYRVATDDFADQGQLSRHGASAWLSRLCRRQTARCRGAGGR